MRREYSVERVALPKPNSLPTPTNYSKITFGRHSKLLINWEGLNTEQKF